METNEVMTYEVGSDVENAEWGTDGFYVSLENGRVMYFALGNAAPVFTLQAHDKPCSALAVNKAHPSIFVTGSVDGKVKVWEVRDGDQLQPVMKAAKNLDLGKVFSAAYSVDPDSPHVVAVGGSSGQMAVWDTISKNVVRMEEEGDVSGEDVDVEE